LNGKDPGSHSKKSSIPTEVELPKVVNSPSSIEKPKLETLYSPNNGSPKVIKSHEYGENSISTEVELPKVVKSSSSIEKPKLETLYSPNNGSNVIESHEDGENTIDK
jgi:hypothetical protein